MANTATIIAEIHTGIGIPANQPVPRKPNASPSPVMGNPWVHSMVIPRAMVSMASVATNGGTLNLVMEIPFTNPSKAPTKMPTRLAPRTVKPTYVLRPEISIPFFSNPAVTAPANARIDPTDRSMPPVRMTNVIPTEMQTLTEICRITFQVFSTVKNRSDRKLITIINSNNAIRD